MEGMLGAAYPWVKAVHIIFVIFWMAGMFMLPRFFAYHVECEAGGAEDALWQERERRLMRIIINPAMIIAWILGLSLVAHVGLGAGGWLHTKLLLVVLLSGFHGWLSAARKRLAAGERRLSSRQFRLINELPSLFIIAIVILAIVKPF